MRLSAQKKYSAVIAAKNLEIEGLRADKSKARATLMNEIGKRERIISDQLVTIRQQQSRLRALGGE